jgi:hypothetical protein
MMAGRNFIIPKTKKTIQIHPRVLGTQRECCECEHGREVPGWTFNMNCTFHDREVNRHDECSAFSAAPAPTDKRK